MSDDAEARKAETMAQFNSRAGDFDPQGVFAHFGQRLVAELGIEPGNAYSTWRPAVVPYSSQPWSGLAQRAKRSASIWPRAWCAPRTRRPSAAGWAPLSASWTLSSSTSPMPSLTACSAGSGSCSSPIWTKRWRSSGACSSPGGRLGVSTWQVSQAEDLHAVLDDLGLAGSTQQRPPAGSPNPMAWRMCSPGRASPMFGSLQTPRPSATPISSTTGKASEAPGQARGLPRWMPPRSSVSGLLWPSACEPISDRMASTSWLRRF